MSDDNSSSSETELQSDVDQMRKRKCTDSSPKRQKSKKNRKELLKAPTTEELNKLRETENLYSSNLIRLQIEEVLAEINVKEKFIHQIEHWCSQFDGVIKNLEDKEDISIGEISLQTNEGLSKRSKFINALFEKTTILKHDKDFVVKFIRPESCSIFGEYQLQCLSKTDIQVNIDVKIPAACFSTKDYLNNRYFIKRHYYLVYLLHSLKKKVSASKIEMLFYDNLKFLPFIQIQPEFSDKIKINVFASISENFFNLNRFLPDRNNVKYDFSSDFKDIKVKDFGEIGTPIYNSFIAHDCTLQMNYNVLQNLLNVKNIQDGIKLLILWLTQRQMNKGTGNFVNELVCYTIAYLVKTKKINAHMSSYQVVRIFWSFMKDSKWNEEPISLSDDVKMDTINMFRENYDIVFLDASGSFNVASFLRLGVYLRLKQEAHLALQILDGNKFNAFSSLFLAQVPFILQYDVLLMLKDKNRFATIYENITPERKWKYYGFYDILITNELSNILQRGLTNRVSSIVPHIYQRIVEENSNTANITFGINLNPEFAFNIIERGPSEDNPAAVKQFQEFWKGLTSFRRFQDSSVAEVVYFQCRTLQDKRNIFLRILEFLFTKKYPIDIKVVANEFEKVLKLEKTIIHFPTGTNEEACLKVKHIYTDLNKILRGLQLPLIITNIQGSSDVFSYTEVFPPVPTTYKEDQNLQNINNKLILSQNIQKLLQHVTPIECVVQMGKSSGWPDDVKVLRCMKCEFYIRLSELLESECNIISSVTLDYLDIFYEGLVFRIRLFVPKELMLLKKIVDNEGIVSYKDNEESLKLERELEILPKVTSALSGLHHSYPSFGPTCALIKRWLRSQMIDNYHISNTVINLWNASVFLNDPPYETAQLPQVAFLRFLKYLIDFDWKLNPVIVNFNDDISKSELSDIEARFQQNRNSYPHLYVVTPYDQSKSIFTKQHPSKHILKRIRLLASETYKFLIDAVTKWDVFSVKDLFIPSLQGYDVLIYLKTTLNPLSHQSTFLYNSLDMSYIERYDKTISTKMPVVDFNPVDKYIKELREIYREYAVFFHDSYGGNVIGILWNKHVLEPRDFKVLHVNAKKVVNGKLTINYDVILEDIYNRGYGLIKSIEKNVII